MTHGALNKALFDQVWCLDDSVARMQTREDFI